MQVTLKLLFIIAVTATAVMSQPPQPAESQLFEQVYLAKDDGRGNAGEAATEFAPTDIPIHCVVILSNASSVTVKMVLIAVNVAGIKGEREVVSTSYTTKDMQDRVFFNGRPYKLWVPGGYRADIYIDGNLVGKLPFLIKGSTAPAKPALNFQPKQPKQTAKPRSTTAKKI